MKTHGLGISRYQRGFSLVELMVALVLGLALVAAVGALSVNTLRSYRVLNLAGGQIENGRYAFKLIRDDVEHAGFWGVFNPASLSLPSSQPDPCVTSTPPLKNLADSVLLPVTGTCAVTLTSKLGGTNTLILLRASSRVAPCSEIDDDDKNKENTYIQTIYDTCIIGKNTSLIKREGSHIEASTVPKPDCSLYSLVKPDDSKADIRQFHVRIYYIRSYSQTGDGIPTLMRKDPINGDGAADAMVEGIENMQIRYGIDDNRDGFPDRYTTATAPPNSMSDWSNIVAVKIFLLVRDLQATSGYTDTATYDLGGLSVTPGGAYHRRVFSQTIRLINPAGRREQ
ncbi:MAG: PilW family protein [Methylococcus sp.]